MFGHSRRCAIDHSVDRGRVVPGPGAVARVRSVGAGGGSIADVAEVTKSLRVGPRSAGAEPGPVLREGRRRADCHRCQRRARLSSAALLLAARWRLISAAPRPRWPKSVSYPWALRRRSGEGHDRYCHRSHARRAACRDGSAGLLARFPLVSFGGAGALHANALAALLGCFPVLVPPSPVCCRRSGSSRPSSTTSSSRPSFVDVGLDHAARCGRVHHARRKAERVARGAGGRRKGPSHRVVVDLRYDRQGFELPIECRRARYQIRLDRRNRRSLQRQSTTGSTASGSRDRSSSSSARIAIGATPGSRNRRPSRARTISPGRGGESGRVISAGGG